MTPRALPGGAVKHRMVRTSGRGLSRWQASAIGRHPGEPAVSQANYTERRVSLARRRTAQPRSVTADGGASHLPTRSDPQ